MQAVLCMPYYPELEKKSLLIKISDTAAFGIRKTISSEAQKLGM